MGTPATALAAVMHTVVTWFGVLWVSALATSRIYMFHEAYQSIIQDLQNDARLLQMCQDAEFLSLMKQHTDVCAQVQLNADVNPWLKALNVALSSPTLCGTEPCTDIAARVVSRGGFTAVGCMLLAALCSPYVLLPALTRWKRWFVEDPAPPACVPYNYGAKLPHCYY